MTGLPRLHRMTTLLLLGGLAVAGVTHESVARIVAANDRRLLQDQASEAGMVMSSMLTQMKTGLASLAGSAGATPDPAVFTRLASPLIGAADGYASLSLLRVQPAGVTQLATAGQAAGRPTSGSDLAAELSRVSNGAGFAITGFAGAGPARRMGTAIGSPYLPPGYVVYAEMPLPADLVQDTIPGNSYMSDMQFAIYLGAEDTGQVVFSSTAELPLSGQRAYVVIDQTESQEDFARAVVDPAPGELTVPPTAILVVMHPTAHPSGAVAGALPKILAGGFLLALLIVVALLESAMRRRDEAMRLVADLESKNTALDHAVAEEKAAVAARVKLEGELRQAQRMEAVGRLAGGIAHDFNNLLAVILSYTGFIAEEVHTPRLRDDVEEVRRAANRAAELTRQLLIFSRRDQVDPQVIDLNAVVNNMGKLLRRTLGEDVELEMTTSPDPCTVLADATELEQVVLNLAVNARDALPRGGRIGLRTESDEHVVRLVVTDNGEGMTEEVATRAFEPFYTTKGPGKGTGLGLATVYGIVTRWGGHAAIHSAPGLGTEIVVELPVTSDAVLDAQPTTGPSRPARGERILVVEDEPGVRLATIRMLERAGYQVWAAADAPMALDYLLENDMDLVLTDVVMPGGLTGRDLAERLHSLRPAVPVVYMSGYSADVMAGHELVDPAAVILEKPFTEDFLLSTLRTVLDGSGVRS